MDDLVADEMPETSSRCVERIRRNSVMATGALSARLHPAFRSQHLQMPADRGLRQLENGPQLIHGQLIPLEGEQQPAPRRIGEGGHLAKNSRRGHRLNPFIRIKGYNVSI